MATICMGLCRGFAEVDTKYRLVDAFDLARCLREDSVQLVALSGYDYAHLEREARHLLRKVPHFVWVNPWFPNLESVYEPLRLPDPRFPGRIVRRILDSEPAFVYAPVPPSCLCYYESWAAHGMSVRSLPLACDTARYYRSPSDTRFSDVQVAFVGGYRGYKSRQFEKYLRPYEDQLVVYGYDRWPYHGYRGLLGEDDERVLYQNARLCPALSEPHAELMGDIVERAFKIMGSGGLAIVDVTPAYRELFTDAELMMPRSLPEYHELVSATLTDEIDVADLRRRGYEAVIARHTYAHRARQVLEWLGIRP
ncbi:MAG TPA: glycosyltransferase [Thermoleophilia bacterium]|nr:glycosyltransferase [Thermoleophilia bacterium]